MTQTARRQRRRATETGHVGDEVVSDAEGGVDPTVSALDFAHPLRRVYAFLIDVGVLMMVIFMVAPVAGGRVFSPEAAVVDVFVFLGYFVVPTGLFGRTPGKWVAGISVVDDEGVKPGVAVAIPREMVGRFVATISVGVGLAWILFDPQRQGWHDKIAGTYVINTPNSGGPGFVSRFFFPDEKSGDEKSRTNKTQRHSGRPAERQKRWRRGKSR